MAKELKDNSKFDNQAIFILVESTVVVTQCLVELCCTSTHVSYILIFSKAIAEEVPSYLDARLRQSNLHGHLLPAEARKKRWKKKNNR